METVTVRCIISNSAYMKNECTYKGTIRVSKYGVSYFNLPGSDMDYDIGQHVILCENNFIPLISV